MEANDALQDTAITNIQTEQATQNTRLDDLEAEQAVQDGRLDALEAGGGSGQNQNGPRIDALEANDTIQDNRLDALEANDAVQDTDIDNLQTNDATQDSRLDALEANDAIQDADIDALQANDTVQDNRLTALETNDAAQDAAISDLQDQVGKGIRAVFNNNQTVQATPTVLSFDVEQYNTDNTDFTLNANGTITVNTSGLYLLTSGVVISPSAISAVGESALIIRVNGNGVAGQTAEGTLDIGTTRALSCATAIQLEAGDVVDATANATSILGIGNILSLLLPFLFGINAQQINHLSISRL